MPAVHRTFATAARIASHFGSGPVSVADVLASGVTEGQLRAAVRSGALVRLRHGVVALPEQSPSLDNVPGAALDQRRAQHRRDLEAAIAALGPEAVVSHASAALLHGLPSLRPGRLPVRPVVTVPSHGRIRTGIHARLGTVPDSDRDLVDGLPCTSVSRTALDVARFRPLHESLVVMDPAVARCGAEEKRREDALREAGFTVVRWTSDELWRTPDVPLARVRTALTR